MATKSKPKAKSKAPTQKVTKTAIDKAKGLYSQRDSKTGKFVSPQGRTKSITRSEILKMKPLLKKLSDYDKGKKRQG